MNTIGKLTMALAIVAVSAFADDRLMGMRETARDLEREYRGIHQAVKSKTFNAAELQARLDGTSERVQKLKALAAEIESGNPKIASTEDWKKAKDLVTLIEIFHTEKSKLAPAADKKRSWIRGHADGLAKRSAMLADVTEQLAKNSGA